MEYANARFSLKISGKIFEKKMNIFLILSVKDFLGVHVAISEANPESFCKSVLG